MRTRLVGQTHLLKERTIFISFCLIFLSSFLANFQLKVTGPKSRPKANTHVSRISFPPQKVYIVAPSKVGEEIISHDSKDTARA